MNNYWLVLLNNWKSAGHDGFTLPFIIGSQKFLKATVKTQNIDDLLTDIIDTEGSKIYIKYCLTTEEIILGIYDEEKNRLEGHFPSYKGQPQQKLFLTSFLNDLGDSVESIVESLTNKYQHQIDKKEFSKHKDRMWGDFDGEEKGFIQFTFTTSKLI